MGDDTPLGRAGERGVCALPEVATLLLQPQNGGTYVQVRQRPGYPRVLLNARPSVAGGSLSEARVKRGNRAVRGGEKELLEKLGRNDPCVCGSARRFQELLHEAW